MSEYYYVGFANKCDEYKYVSNKYELEKYDTYLEIKKFLGVNNQIVFKGIRSVYVREQKLFRTKTDVKYEDIPMICELVNKKFIDVVTGKVYRQYDPDKDYVGPDILLNIGKKISSDEVVKFLKSLDKQDLFRYQDAVEEFEKAMSIGYSKYISKQNMKMKQNESNDNYIKNFRLTHK